MKNAAAYVRMSTEHQRYSIPNQLAEIEVYCEQNGFTLVRLYADAGISGLTFENRPGLRSLIGDAETGNVPFEALVVLDVSRWGRFQNPDEGAYYEHILRRVGVRMIYCGEPFENDDSPAATIIKSVKRAMAAEFSRELSRKVKAGLRRNAANGFRGGGLPGYGLRRIILSRDGTVLHVANRGERKAIQDGRTVLGFGPAHEVRTVRRIFRLYVRDRWRIHEIAKQLNSERSPATKGAEWTKADLSRILSNEKYAGTCLFGLSSESLGSRRKQIQPALWVRVPGAYPAIVSLRLFNAAQEIRNRRIRKWSREDIIQGLKGLYAKRGVITRVLLEASTEVPNLARIRENFGSIQAALVAAGIPHQSNGEKRAIMGAARKSAMALGPYGVTSKPSPVSMVDWKSILGQAIAQQQTVSEVAFEVGCPAALVRRQAKLHRAALAARPSSKAAICWSRELASAAKKGETVGQLASLLRVHPSEVEWAMARNKITLRPTPLPPGLPAGAKC